MLTRLFQPKAVHGHDTKTVHTCAGVGAVVSGSDITGRVLDTLGLGRGYEAAMPVATLDYPGATSTTATRTIALDVRLQQGDSSGGGDMADISPMSQASTQPLQAVLQAATAATSTGAVRGTSLPGVYDVRPAKRYLRMVTTPTYSAATSSGQPLANVTGTVLFGIGDELPHSTGITQG